jgi:hypothetical protein
MNVDRMATMATIPRSATLAQVTAPHSDLASDGQNWRLLDRMQRGPPAKSKQPTTFGITANSVQFCPKQPRSRPSPLTSMDAVSP